MHIFDLHHTQFCFHLKRRIKSARFLTTRIILGVILTVHGCQKFNERAIGEICGDRFGSAVTIDDDAGSVTMAPATVTVVPPAAAPSRYATRKGMFAE